MLMQIVLILFQRFFAVEKVVYCAESVYQIFHTYVEILLCSTQK